MTTSEPMIVLRWTTQIIQEHRQQFTVRQLLQAMTHDSDPARRRFSPGMHTDGRTGRSFDELLVEHEQGPVNSDVTRRILNTTMTRRMINSNMIAELISTDELAEKCAGNPELEALLAPLMEEKPR